MCPLSFFDILCYLESFFHVEEEESAHVNPCAAGYCLERVLDETSVARLVVPGVEAVLKDACLDVVAFLAFLPRNGVHLPSDFAAFDCFVVKITVSFRRRGNSPWIAPALLTKYLIKGS